ncbi:MAG: sensor histidine kinase [Hymenobacteraceae bacterium]|nr:sensor histidine kinase [Hymenobacteraceae bacterium]MDX5423129.1 sensor histidine kinase [Hymenobacteraceae bacterium]
MQRIILKINIANELDVVLAYKRAMQLSERLNMAMANQTKFATAVSEVCRNVVEHVGSGSIRFSLVEEAGFHFLEAYVEDRGRGIGNLELILSGNYYVRGGKGTGLVNSKKLVDYFNIESEFEKGTRVTLRRKLPPRAPGVSKALLDQWAHEFGQETDISPYAEIKKQNMQLLELLEELRLRNLEAEKQLQEIRRLNSKLQESNQSISELLEERERKNLLLQNANENLDAFAHTVSHDLRAPLQNIDGLTNALESSLHTQHLEEAQFVLPLLRQQTQKMDRLITGILAYSLAGHQSIPKKVVNTHQLLSQVIESLHVPFSFRINIQQELPTFYTQEIFLYQVFSNIIGNAVKYHDKPEMAQVHISCTVEPDQVVFTVEDNGPGIPEEVQQEIFSMYETGQATPRQDSTGLGLSIVKKIVSEKGGKVWVHSQGRGSRFGFSWPAEDLVTEEQA